MCGYKSCEVFTLATNWLSWLLRERRAIYGYCFLDLDHAWGDGSWMSPMVRIFISLICSPFPTFSSATTPGVYPTEWGTAFISSRAHFCTRFPTAPQRSRDFGSWCRVPFISHTKPANKVSDSCRASWETLFIIICLWSNNNSSRGEQLCFHPSIMFWKHGIIHFLGISKKERREAEVLRLKRTSMFILKNAFAWKALWF